MRSFSWLRLVSLLVAASVAMVGVAGAQEANQPGVARLVDMNKRALREYDARNWNGAKKTLLEAVSAGKKLQLEGHGVMARTYLHLGAVWIVGFSDRDKARWSFERALEIDPAIQIRSTMETPELNATFEEARKNVAAAAATAGTGAAAPAVDAVTAQPPSPVPGMVPLDCPSSGEAPSGKPIAIRCLVAAELPVATLHLFYREPGKQQFSSVELAKGPDGWQVGEIPQSVGAAGGTVQYYVEGRDANGKPIVSNGHSGSPNIMLVHKGSEEALPGPALQTEETIEENPLDPGTMRRLRSARRGADTRYGNRRFWIGLGGGSGAGYAKGDGLEARPDLQAYYEAGFGWAGLGHLVPEIGYHVTPDIAISIQGRVQWIPQEPEYEKMYATGAEAVLARLLFFTKQQRLRLFGSVMAGGGSGFRFTLHPDENAPKVKDTVRGGPGLAGVGGGVCFELIRAISLVAEINALAGFPDVSVVADLNLGVQFNIH